MPRRKKRGGKHDRVYDKDHCRLIINYHGPAGARYKLSGCLPRVSLADREELAFYLSGWLHIPHDEAYDKLWKGVKRQWEDVLQGATDGACNQY